VVAALVFRRLERAKLITTPEANAAQDDLMQLDIELFPFEPFAGRIWELRHNVTSYDACVVKSFGIGAGQSTNTRAHELVVDGNIFDGLVSLLRDR
jgi:hypothetical protein